MERIRTYLNPIRATQLKEIAANAGFESIAQYLDSHILSEWQKIHGKPILPGFEIYTSVLGDGEHVVYFAMNGTTAIHITAKESAQFADGITSVISNQQRSFFIASTIDPSVLCFSKQGTGYQFTIKFSPNDKKLALSESIAKDLSNIFKHHSTNGGIL